MQIFHNMTTRILLYILILINRNNENTGRMEFSFFYHAISKQFLLESYCFAPFLG